MPPTRNSGNRTLKITSDLNLGFAIANTLNCTSLYLENWAKSVISKESGKKIVKIFEKKKNSGDKFLLKNFFNRKKKKRVFYFFEKLQPSKYLNILFF
jgi:hypothetical protein